MDPRAPIADVTAAIDAFLADAPPCNANARHIARIVARFGWTMAEYAAALAS